MFRCVIAGLVAALAVAATASAAPWRSGVGAPIEPPYAAGSEGEGLMIARVRAPGGARVFGLAAFEKLDVPVWEPGTVGDCFAYGDEEGLRSFVALHWGITCFPRGAGELRVSLAHYKPAGGLSPARYRALRRRRARLPGVTLLAGRAGTGVSRIVVRGPGGRRRIVPTGEGGGFLVAWRDWLEAKTVTVRGEGARQAWRLRIARARLQRNRDAPPSVIPPYVALRPLR